MASSNFKKESKIKANFLLSPDLAHLTLDYLIDDKTDEAEVKQLPSTISYLPSTELHFFHHSDLLLAEGCV